jgi:hypothetical protein
MEWNGRVTGVYLIEQNWEGRGNIEAITWRDRDNLQKTWAVWYSGLELNQALPKYKQEELLLYAFSRSLAV